MCWNERRPNLSEQKLATANRKARKRYESNASAGSYEEACKTCGTAASPNSLNKARTLAFLYPELINVRPDRKADHDPVESGAAWGRCQAANLDQERTGKKHRVSGHTPTMSPVPPKSPGREGEMGKRYGTGHTQQTIPKSVNSPRRSRNSSRSWPSGTTGCQSAVSNATTARSLRRAFFECTTDRSRLRLPLLDLTRTSSRCG